MSEILNKRVLARRHQLLLKVKQYDNIFDLLRWINSLPKEDRDFLRNVIKQEDVGTY